MWHTIIAAPVVLLIGIFAVPSTLIGSISAICVVSWRFGFDTAINALTKPQASAPPVEVVE